jgi:predicted kinase
METKRYNQAMSKLIILSGKPYAGKTTLGKTIVQQFGYETVDVDVTKEHLYGLGLKDDDLTHEQWIHIYDETDKQIATYLKEGKSVIDDSRNFRKFERVHAKAIADQCAAGFVTIYVNTPEEMLRERLLDNRLHPTRHDLEDQDFEELLTLFEPPTEDEHPLLFNGRDGLEEWIAGHASELV